MALGYAGNGNVLTAADSVNGSWTYTYDGVNRLLTALWPTQASFSYSYDRYGNMSCVQNIQGGQPCTPALAFNAANNRITNTGYTYDAAGNLLSDTAHQYHYDGENRIDCVGTDANGNCLTTSVYYYYDAQGRRVGKQQGNTLEEYVYDLAGNITSVHDGSGSVVRTELYAGGRHVATRDSSGTLSWNHADWLGTERVRTSSTGTVSEQCTDMPFGMNLSCTPSPDLSPMHFTGKQRDTESALDNFGARYYGGGNNLGRFITPDPLGGNILDPQTLNKYSYVRNNPINLTDPTGLYICSDSKDCSSDKDRAFEKERKRLLESKNADVKRAAEAYGEPKKDNGVSVGFKDLSGSGEDGNIVSTIGTDANGNLRANSDVTINSKASGADFDAAIGHEGSHAADAQDVVRSGLTEDGQAIHAGMNITPYQSEQRAYGVTNSILNSANESRNYICGSGGCPLGRGVNPGDVSGNVDRLVGSNPIYNQGGRPMSSTNQGPSVVNGVTPKATVPSVPH